MGTIFAEATPPGRGGVSVVRISGPQACAALKKLAGNIGAPRVAHLRLLQDGDDIIDRALVLWFQDGASFTGEEVVELHLHGAPVIVARIASALLSMGLRRAEAGEFTKRAFLNGKIDLAEAEGLADLLAAETEAQRKLAIRAADGEIGRLADGLRQKLIRAGALIEASIDFADEEVPEDITPEAFDLLNEVRKTLIKLSDGFPATERLRQGYEVAIIGPPNAGKSTLLNKIAQREVALVSNVAGTTRDIIELRVDLHGLPVTFLDTAGLRESIDPVETMGVERALDRAERADLRIHLSEDGAFQQGFRVGDILAQSKSDLGQRANAFSVSAVTGEGIRDLLEQVYNELKDRVADSSLISHKRQAEAIDRAIEDLNVDPSMPAELLAEAVRQANHQLSAMVGRVGAEDYLDEIFRSFCIGK